MERVRQINNLLRASLVSKVSRERKKATRRGVWPFEFNPATTYSPTQLARAVQSARRGLTSVFGMGTGVTLAV
jgi:hypothetical protein